MRRNCPIQLVMRTYEGDTPLPEPPREILARRKSIRQAEFYQSVASGFRPEITFVVWEAEYHGEDRVFYQNREYEIIRRYPLENELEIELICQPVDDANRNLNRLRQGF